MNSFRRLAIPQIIISVVLSTGLVFSTYLATSTYFKVKNTKGVITVTGSAKKEIKSDFVVWKGQYSVQFKTLPEAYSAIKANQEKVKSYLGKKKIDSTNITFSSIETFINYYIGPNGYSTNEIQNYRLTQTVEIKSNDVDKIASLARESTELIQQGVEFQSLSPQYFYTKLADLKINMLALATKDAKERATKIAQNSGTKVTGVKKSRMGVFQITPLYSNEISDYGINDTFSVEKEIMAVMNCEFETE